MSVVIGKAGREDAAAMIDFLKTVGGETDNLTFGAEGLPITIEAEAAFIVSIENSFDDIMLLAKENGEIIGSASLNRMPRRMSHIGDFSVSVLKKYWNKGVGRMLIDGILDFASENGFEIINLQVRSDNKAAIHLYEKYGFKKIGTHPASFKINGEYIPFDYMYLTLK